MIEAAPTAAATLEREETVQAPVDISETARQQFAEWGLNDGQVQELQMMVGAYEYGAADRKIQRAIGNGIYIDADKNMVALPGYIDYLGDRTDGQCSEIALRTYGDVRKDWLERVNAGRQENGQKPLNVEFTVGQSGEYFNAPGAKHYWASLTDGAMPPEKTVVLDGSLRKIGIADEEEFKVEESIAPTELSRYTTPQLPLEEFTRDDSGWPMIGKVPPSMVLGMSESGDAALSFGFMHEPNEGTVLPAVIAIAASGHCGVCFVGGNERGTNWVMTDPTMSISLEARDEAEKLLGMLSDANPIVASTAEVDAASTPDQRIVF